MKNLIKIKHQRKPVTMLVVKKSKIKKNRHLNKLAAKLKKK